MEFRDLKAQYAALKSDIDAGIADVLKSGHFISGPQVTELENKLAEYVGVKHCITCANGTDALTVALMAWGIGAGDAVFVPDFTFFASGECPAFLGATPVFVDVEPDSYNIDPEKLEIAVQSVIKAGKYKPKVVLAVDLFGQPADYPKIRAICNQYDLFLLEDGAQGFGGKIGNQKACSFGDISTTSFFPAKPLGCYGDGGAIFTDDDHWAALIRSLCVHGKSGDDKYNNIRLGMNSRLDTIQAAILLAKFRAFTEYELDAVNHAAELYNGFLKDTSVSMPVIKEGFYSSRAQYTIQFHENINRDAVQAALRGQEIPSMIYYPRSMHRLGAFANTDSADADCPVTEMLCKTVLSLPLHPYMERNDIIKVTDGIYNAIRQQREIQKLGISENLKP